MIVHETTGATTLITSSMLCYQQLLGVGSSFGINSLVDLPIFISNGNNNSGVAWHNFSVAAIESTNKQVHLDDWSGKWRLQLMQLMTKAKIEPEIHVSVTCENQDEIITITTTISGPVWPFWLQTTTPKSFLIRSADSCDFVIYWEHIW